MKANLTVALLALNLLGHMALAQTAAPAKPATPPAPAVDPKAIDQKTTPPRMDVNWDAEDEEGRTLKPVIATLKKYGLNTDVIPLTGKEPPVEVVVDKTRQTITITAPGLKKPIVKSVSTGGTLRIASAGTPGDRVYCGHTPDYPRHAIYATPGNMEIMHSSNRFKHDDGAGSPMPWTVWMNRDDGIAFHESPEPAKLGTAVSGGCIREDSETARLLFGLALKYGGIMASASGADPVPTAANRCDDERVERTLARLGCEDQKCQNITTADNEEESSGPGFWASIFGGGGKSSSKPSKPMTPEESRFRNPLGQQ